MASIKFVLLAVSLLVATSSTAPQNSKLGITIPEACRREGFCSIRPVGYDDIEAKINALFPQDLIDVGSKFDSGHTWEPSDDDDNCPSVTTLESVYTYDDPNETKVDIFVQTKLFPQTIVKVTCKYGDQEYKNLKEGGSQCFRKLGLSEFNMQSRCEESYATRTLMVYDPEQHLFKIKNYTVPVCCSCITSTTV